MQEKSKQLMWSQQCILAPKSTDLFSFEELERKEADQHFRKTTLLQLYPWRISDSKQAPAVYRLLQITQELVLETYLTFLVISSRAACTVLRAPKLVSTGVLPKLLPSSSREGCHGEHVIASQEEGRGKSQPTSQNKSTVRSLRPQILQPGQHQVNIALFGPLLKRDSPFPAYLLIAPHFEIFFFFN